MSRKRKSWMRRSIRRTSPVAVDAYAALHNEKGKNLSESEPKKEAGA